MAMAWKSPSAAAAPTSCRRLADPGGPGKTGRRTDGRNLTEEWTKKQQPPLRPFDQAGFDAIDVATGPKVLGLFEVSHMEYEADREKDGAKSLPSPT